MITLHFVLADGTRRSLQAKEGEVVMQVARRNGIEGILAECGGVCSCATCHVHIDAAWVDKLPAKAADEVDILEFAEGVDETSRLSCQLKVTGAMDGVVINVPESQY